MTTRTGATLGNFDVLEHIEPLPRERHTYCVTDQVDNPSLRAAMSFFDDSLGVPIQRSTSILAGQVQESVRSLEPAAETSTHKFDDVVDVIRDLQRRLGIDLKDVLTAANIKPRTYHSWAQPSAPRPRLASQGRLWALAQLVDDLPEVLDVPIRQWLLADSKRLVALRAGRFDELLEQASQEHMQQDPTGTVVGPFHGVGEDSPPSLRTSSRELVVDEQAITEPALPPRRPPELPRI